MFNLTKFLLMRKILYCLMSILFAVSTVVTAQDILDVAPGIGTLNAAIKANGGNKVYRLKAGYTGFYVLTEIIENSGFNLSIIGAEPAAGEMPATLQTNAPGGVPFEKMFDVLGNLTLKNIYIVNAASNGAIGYEVLTIQKPDIRVIVDKCIVDPSGHFCSIQGGGNNKIYITNSLMMRMMANNSSVNDGTMFRLGEASSISGVDTLLLENNTFVGIGTNLLSNDFSDHIVHNYMSINHNTMVHLKCQLDWIHNQKEFYFTNNLLYDFGVVPYPAKWAGGWDGYPAADTVVQGLLWSYPKDIVVNKPTATSFVEYNSVFLNSSVIDALNSLKAWNNSNTEKEFFYLQPLVWTSADNISTNLGIDNSFAIKNNVEANIYNKTGFPKWKAGHNTYGLDPVFADDSISIKSKILAEWVVPAYKKDYRSIDDGGKLSKLNWYFDHDGSIGKNDAWPVFDGKYSNAETMSASIDGLPAGDLNWFPEKKVIWLKNKQAIHSHILALNTDKMDLSTLSDQDIVWDFEIGVQGWHDLGAGRDVTASWDNGFFKMTYFDGEPTKGPQLWFAAVQVEQDFDASKYRYLQISYKTVSWPTAMPVKMLITFTNSKNELVYSYADIDPAKTSVTIDIAALDPGWGKSYIGLMKSVQLELPHNGDPAANPATAWFGASTMIDKVVLTNAQPTGAKNLIHESISIYPNPATKSFNVSGTDVEQISIYNTSGILIKKFTKTNRNISVEGFVKGLYIVKIESKDESIIKKLIVE